MNKEYFITVIKDHQSMIYKVCNSYCRNPSNRKDLEQEIIIQIWQALPKFNGSVKLSTWIYKVALNTAISFFRKEQKTLNNTLDMDVSVLSISTNETEYPDEEKMQILQGFIRELKELDKALMILYLDNKKQSEIAIILGISESNVATKINRIKESFKKKAKKLKAWN